MGDDKIKQYVERLKKLKNTTLMKKNIAVIYGGYSSEHEISVKSGQYIASIIDKSLFNVFEIKITKLSWFEIKTKANIDKNDFSLIIDNKKIKFDAVVNIIHGTPGEDGILQSYFDLLDISYTGCNALSSALSFNKYYCNNYLRNFNIRIAKSFIVRKNDFNNKELNDFIDSVGLPVFVKPSSGGSSFGTNKVKKTEDLQNAIDSAFNEADEVLIEEFISGRELTCGVVKINGQINAFTPVEIVSKHEFFDYESKYNSNLNQEIIPAPIDEALIEKIKQEAQYIYKKLNCNGIVRVDYILRKNELFFLELNSVPGMTSESIVPKMIKYDDIDISELFTAMINKAMDKKN